MASTCLQDGCPLIARMEVDDATVEFVGVGDGVATVGFADCAADKPSTNYRDNDEGGFGVCSAGGRGVFL